MTAARGTLVGLTRGSGRPEIVRAVLEGVAHRAADLVEAADSWNLLVQVPAGRTVALGLVDARNTRLEDPARVAQEVRRARSMRNDLSWQLCTTASLEYLPVDRAAMKVARLTEAARLASNGG